jgi:outer membrane receptor for ferrienterochelin and colicins
MKKLLALVSFVFFFNSTAIISQERQAPKKINVKGKVIDKSTSQPLEYATIVLQNAKRPEMVTGGITNEKGEFDIEINAGMYDIRVEFISFKTVEFKQRKLQENTDLGTVILSDDSTELDGVELRADRSTVEIKLDKRVYNVGQDMMVKGGTVSDVLDNVPSVSVDVDGTVSLRGNESVRILIDGRPSNAININDALRLIPADAIDKVEVITNPSARYDAEGGGGIINIILKKGKNQGLNGTVTGTIGVPTNRGLTGNINFKSDNFNLFTNQGFNYRESPGNSLTDSEYFNADGTTRNYIYERRTNSRNGNNYNGNFGFDWYLDPTITWTNTFSYRKNTTDNPEHLEFNNYDANNVFQYTRVRELEQTDDGENIDFSSNFVKKFKKDGHKLTTDFSFSDNADNEFSYIRDTDFDDVRTNEDQIQRRTIVQADYVLPIGENGRFEVGFKGDYTESNTDFRYEDFNDSTNSWTQNDSISNIFQYKEFVNALYTQYGNKINKFSYFFGLRWEDSNIDVNQLVTNDYNNKRYNNFFPSAVFAYEFSEATNTSLSYSRRIQRPRGRFLNPFPNYSSNINIFQGNPDLNPAMTHAIDIVFLQKWSKVTLSSSAYFNLTEESFQFIRKESGAFVETEGPNGEITETPIILTTPINLATQYRFGFEFNLNYSPFKWWRLNGNFNFFRNETEGDYTYTNFVGEEVVQNLDNTAISWTTRITSKITLPYKIDWQANGTYNAPQTTAQGKQLGVVSANLAFSKDILKDKATIALNVSDLFNSRKRITETNLPSVSSYSEMQWRERQINLSFTYRFNKQKNERERQPKREGGEEEFMGKP